MNIHSKILSFFNIGYFLDYPGDSVRLPEKIKHLDQSGLTREVLYIKLPQKLLKSFVTGCLPGHFHVVSFSGRFDSRAVLDGLLQFAEASNIITYTYGIPGLFDYEIAACVVRKTGVNNFRIPSEKYDFTLEEVVDTTRRKDYQTLMFY